MKQYNVTIQGTADLLQNSYPLIEGDPKGGKKSTTAKDYSSEWRGKLYLLDDGGVYQPESHLLGCLVKAAVTVKIPGRRGKTYKDPVKATVFIVPSCIPHNGINLADFEEAKPITGPAPDGFASKVYIDRRVVRVQRAAVVRYRPAIVKGWELSFRIDVLDDDFQGDVLKGIMDTAGAQVGIGDYRPRYGRFMVTRFEQID